MWSSTESIGEVSSSPRDVFASTSADVGVPPLERVPWWESVTDAQIHRVRVGDRVVLGISVLVARGPDRPSAQVVLGGELCPSTAPALRQHLAALVEGGVVCMHVDVSKLRLCTAAGVEALEAIGAEATKGGGGLWLQGASGVVARVFEILDVRQERPPRCFGADGRRRTREAVPSLASACDDIVSRIDEALDTVTASAGGLPCRSR